MKVSGAGIPCACRVEKTGDKRRRGGTMGRPFILFVLIRHRVSGPGSGPASPLDRCSDSPSCSAADFRLDCLGYRGYSLEGYVIPLRVIRFPVVFFVLLILFFKLF